MKLQSALTCYLLDNPGKLQDFKDKLDKREPKISTLNSTPWAKRTVKRFTTRLSSRASSE